MPINHITIDRAKTLGSQLYIAIDAFSVYQDKLKALKENMDNMTDAADWTKIETQFGLPTGKGEGLYNLVAGAVSELPADTNLQQLIDWVVPQI